MITPSIPLKLQEELGYDVTILAVPTDDKGEERDVEDTYEDMGIEIVKDGPKITKLLMDREAVAVVEDTLLTKWVAPRIKQGMPTLCGYPEIEKWESDRDYGMKVCQKIESYNNSHGNESYNLAVLDQEEFSDFGKAVAFVEKNPARWVIKEAGDCDLRQLNYKGELESGMDVIARLEYLAEKGMGGEKNPHFFLQKRVKGVEVAASAFFNGSEFLDIAEIDFEHQPLLAGDRGPNTGEFINEMWATKTKDNTLWQAVFPPIQAVLKKANFHGFINITGIMHQRGYHPFECTARKGGCPWTTQLYELFYGKMDFGELLIDLSTGGNPGDVKWNGGFTVGARVDVPPTIYQGISAEYLKSSLDKDKHLANKLQSVLGNSDKTIELLKEYSLTKELSYEMPVIVESFHPEKARHFHWSDAKNLRVVEQDGITYGIVEPTGPTFCYITENGENLKNLNQRMDILIDSMAGLPFISRDDYCDDVEEKLAKIESWGWDISIHNK